MQQRESHWSNTKGMFFFSSHNFIIKKKNRFSSDTLHQKDCDFVPFSIIFLQLEEVSPFLSTRQKGVLGSVVI